MSIPKFTLRLFLALGLGLALGIVVLFCNFWRQRQDYEANNDSHSKTVRSFEKEKKVDFLVDKDNLAATGVLNLKGEVAAKSCEVDDEMRVESFDSLTDEWTGGRMTRSLTIKDIDGYVGRFKKVPRKRQKECIQRALNLIPDNNAMLLVGVLMDSDIDVEIVKQVYYDILNRDDSVRKVALRKILTNKLHPCYGDAKWICEAIDEMPAE